MQKRRSQIVDEIIRDYYREQRWKERIAKREEEKKLKEQELKDINNTR